VLSNLLDFQIYRERLRATTRIYKYVYRRERVCVCVCVLAGRQERCEAACCGTMGGGGLRKEIGDFL